MLWMTSGDNMQDMTRLELLLREHFARTDKQLSDMRAENAEFRAAMLKEQREFEARQEARLEAFEARTEARFDGLTAAVVELQRDVTGLTHDVSNLYTWNYWTLSIILALSAMPHVVAGVKSLFGAITEGISGIMSLIRRDGK